MSISDVIENCGGTRAISTHIPSVTQDAVRKWKKSGIPEKHWRALMDLHELLTLEVLHFANEDKRAETL